MLTQATDRIRIAPLQIRGEICFATQDHIKQITGYCHTRKQAESLRRMGFKFIINDLGNIVLLLNDVVERLSGIEKQNTSTEPDFSAIKNGTEKTIKSKPAAKRV